MTKLWEINNNRLKQYLTTNQQHFSFNMWMWLICKNPELFKYVPTYHSNYEELKELYEFLTI